LVLWPKDTGDKGSRTSALSLLACGTFAATGEFEVQAVESGMQTVLGEDEVEAICHLLGGLAASASIGHRQCERDAVGRVEEVAVPLSERLIEVEGKRTVSVDQIRQIRGGHIR